MAFSYTAGREGVVVQQLGWQHAVFKTGAYKTNTHKQHICLCVLLLPVACAVLRMMLCVV